MKRLFMLSTGRSGTTFCKFFFRTFENVVARGEKAPAFKRRGIELVSRDTNFYERNYFKWPRKFDTFGSNCEWYVETNCRLFGSSHLILSAFPDANRFHLIRDGRDVVRSWVNKGRYARADVATRFTPRDVPGDAYQDEWNHMNTLQRNAWSWATRNKIIAQSNPDDIYYFEGIFNSPHSEIFRMLETMELDYDHSSVLEFLDNKIYPTKNYLFPPFPEWRDEWKQQFWEITGEVMENFGYTKNNYGKIPSKVPKAN